MTYQYCTRCKAKRLHYVPDDNPFEQRCMRCDATNTALTDNWIVWKALKKRKAAQLKQVA